MREEGMPDKNDNRQAGAPTILASLPVEKGEEDKKKVAEDLVRLIGVDDNNDSKASAPLPPSRSSSSREQRARWSPKTLALWELFRELDRRGVNYDILESREALESRLTLAMNEAAKGRTKISGEVAMQKYRDQARALSTRKLREILGKNGVGVSADVLALETRGVLENRFAEMMYSYHHEGEQFLQEGVKLIPDNTSPSKVTTSSIKGPHQSSSDVIFSSKEEAEVWASMLSLEELQVELDFLGVSYARSKASSKNQLVHLLAQAMTSGHKFLPDEEEVSLEALRFSSRGRKSRRGQGLVAERAVSIKSFEHSYGGEEKLMDVDRAREELHALFNFTSMKEYEGMEPELGFTAKRNAAGSRARSQNTGRMEAFYEDDGDYDDEDGQYDSVDLMINGIGAVTDRAWGVVQQARSTARELLAVAIAPEVSKRKRRRVTAGGKGKRNNVKAGGVNTKARVKALASQSLSRLGVVAFKASLNSFSQALIGAAKWAGSGLLPARHVLLCSAFICIVTRQGLSSFVVCMLITRALTGTLAGILGDDVDEELAELEEEGYDPSGLVDAVFA